MCASVFYLVFTELDTHLQLLPVFRNDAKICHYLPSCSGDIIWSYNLHISGRVTKLPTHPA